ncbi:glycosyltransferase [Citreimonas salinaria]|uniref:N-terminal domain of galactosyltransferase n=1 Tax=Citreimonas salinaria TaxID=321339 RepID=A0A1H3N481_9RHOB|nr:glycosyltransferase [Citreimonas salinaria]SDY83771.1 N-terminal domain of galactosyltransferase [Citreimonas salinaria]
MRYAAFWAALDAGRRALEAGDTHTAAARLDEARGFSAGLPAEMRAARRALVDGLAARLEGRQPSGKPATGDPAPEAHEIEAPAADMPVPDPAPPAAPDAPLLGPIAAQGVPGTSLVTCAMNRTDNLKRALASWIACDGIDEIVVIDWSSDEPVAPALEAAGLDDPRLRVVRVEGEPRWILSYAFNAGFRLARHDRILKADADIVLAPDFPARNPLPEGTFVAGNWRTATPDQAYVNGFFLAHRADLAAVGGFNEFITTYGWDDDDLYHRLVLNGVRRIDVAPGSLRHLDHDNDARLGHDDDARSGRVPAPVRSAAEEIRATTQWRIRRNHYIAAVMPVWDAAKIPLPLAVEAPDRLRRAAPPVHAVPARIKAAADAHALAEIASWHIGPEVLALEPARVGMLLSAPLAGIGRADLDAALAVQKAAPRLAAPHLAPARPRLFIDAQHGLGNRMRAIGSAAAIAEATGRELVIVWDPDHHCQARLADLFHHLGAIVEESFVAEAAGMGCAVYNYMEIEPGAHKDAALDLSHGGDIYARSAYALNAAPSHWAAENRFLHTLRPTEPVQALVDGAGGPFDVSLHVRMVGAPGTDTASYDRAENWTGEGHAAINHWREQSHYSRFMKRLDALIAAGAADRVFLAADAPETYAAFAETYGDRVRRLERTAYDRSTAQLVHALADAILLGRAPLLLGSTWSSFSELAMRLSRQDIKSEMSGTDF